jgi:hypothetical protein
MAQDFGQSPALGLPKPGKVLKSTMLVLLAIWLIFAVGINWGGAP